MAELAKRRSALARRVAGGTQLPAWVAEASVGVDALCFGFLES